MSKRTQYTVITPLPAGVTRATVMETLHSHTEMIDLNPLVEERHPIKPPEKATAEEFHCVWYSITDKVSYLPGGIVSGKVTYSGCFHDLANGLQTHCYAPLGLDIKGKWTLGGSLPGEPQPPVEMGVGIPLSGLYVREDVDFRCNIVMTSFVKKTLKAAHEKLVGRLVVKSQLVEASNANDRLSDRSVQSAPSSVYSQGSPVFPPHAMTHPDTAARQSLTSSTGSYQHFNPSPQFASSNLRSPSFPSPGAPSPGYSSPGFASPGFPSPCGSPNYQMDPAYQMAHYQQQQQQYNVPVGQHELTSPQQRMYQGTVFHPSELPNYDMQKKPAVDGKPQYEGTAPVELPADIPS